MGVGRLLLDQSGSPRTGVEWERSSMVVLVPSIPGSNRLSRRPSGDTRSPVLTEGPETPCPKWFERSPTVYTAD